VEDQSLYSFIPADFFKPIIEVLAYTFGTEQQAFDEILACMKHAFSHFFEDLEQTEYLNLLNALIVKLKQYDPLWFQSMANVRDLIRDTLKIVELNKIDYFEEKVCLQLL
jgi:hypothetical protein